MNAYELLRENIMNFIHETLKKHLENMPSKWIWHDIFYFDDVNIIKKMLMGAPRNVVQLALKTPYHYLKVDIDYRISLSFKIGKNLMMTFFRLMFVALGEKVK